MECALSRGSRMCYGRVDARRVAREFAVHVRARRTLRTDLSPPPHLSSAFRPRTVDKTHAVLSFHRFIAVLVRDSRARERRTTSGDTAVFARGGGGVARWMRDATRRDATRILVAVARARVRRYVFVDVERAREDARETIDEARARRSNATRIRGRDKDGSEGGSEGGSERAND